MPSAIVIGGGPAGSVAAMLLCRAGWAVTLVEQHRFPRDKVCGECLSALGADVLRRLGIFDALLARGAVRLSRTMLHAQAGPSVDVPLPMPMWGISRAVLDDLLLNAAAAMGCRVLQPARCERVAPGARPVVRIRELSSNSIHSLETDHVIVADGKSALIGGGAPRPSGDLGIKTHFTLVSGSRDVVELFGLNGCYGGLAAIDGGRWNAAFSVPAERVRRHRGNLAAVFQGLAAENAILARRLTGARQCEPWLAAPLPRFGVRASWQSGLTPIGNAVAAIEPIGGEGMGLAMRSSELAVEQILNGRSPARLATSYRRLWRHRAVACRCAALVASRPGVARALTRLLTPAPKRLGPVLRWIGK